MTTFYPDMKHEPDQEDFVQSLADWTELDPETEERDFYNQFCNMSGVHRHLQLLTNDPHVSFEENAPNWGEEEKNAVHARTTVYVFSSSCEIPVHSTFALPDVDEFEDVRDVEDLPSEIRGLFIGRPRLYYVPDNCDCCEEDE